MVEHRRVFDLTEVESWILESIDHVGWYAYLWFPVVQREVLNFGSKVPDADIHAAFATLIKKRALEPSPATRDDVPEWKPAASALEEAKELLSLSLDLSHRSTDPSRRPENK